MQVYCMLYIYRCTACCIHAGVLHVVYIYRCTACCIHTGVLHVVYIQVYCMYTCRCTACCIHAGVLHVVYIQVYCMLYSCRCTACCIHAVHLKHHTCVTGVTQLVRYLQNSYSFCRNYKNMMDVPTQCMISHVASLMFILATWEPWVRITKVCVWLVNVMGDAIYGLVTSSWRPSPVHLKTIHHKPLFRTPI